MKKKYKKFILILIYFLSPVPVFLIFYALTPAKPYHTPLRLIADFMAITAYIWLIYQFILTSRLKFIDRIFGMDKIIHFHIIMSVIAIQLAITKAIIFIIIGKNDITQIGSGINAVVQFIVLMILGLVYLRGSGVKKRRIKYNVAKFIHNFTIFSASYIFLHVLLSNSAYESIILIIIFAAYFFMALGFWLNFKIFRRLKLKKNPYVITEVKNEAGTYWTLYLKSKIGNPIEYKPGQYSYISIIGKEVSKEFHPFSFSSSPAKKNTISFTIKELGDYTNDISKVKVGDIAYIEGPYGIFNALNSDAEEIVFIAGGSGITPFLSFMRYMKDTNTSRNITLLWGIKFPYEIFLKDEFEKMMELNPNLKIFPVVSDDANWEGERGFIDRDKLDRLAPCEDPGKNIQKKDYYICGPPIMMKKVVPTLKSMGVNKKNYIHLEKFNR